MMNRRQFVRQAGAGIWGAGAGLWCAGTGSVRAALERRAFRQGRGVLRADVVIAGGGLGGCAAALAALRNGLRVILLEETDWVGGQLTQQGVPPDEHRWIETSGCTRSYRELREGIRDYYRRHYPLTPEARQRARLNPGGGSVSRLCSEPRVGVAVLESLLLPHASGRRLVLLLEHRVVGAETAHDRVTRLLARDLVGGTERELEAVYFVDATELGDLLPLARAEHVMGAEARADTGELHAVAGRDEQNQQAFTVCFAIDHVAGEDHTIERPRSYSYWRNFVPKLRPPWPGRLLDLTYSHPRTLEPRRLGFNPLGAAAPGEAVNLWTYRRIAKREEFLEGAYAGDITLVNWPQNDYFLGNLIGVSEREARRHVHAAKQLSLSLLYWLQTDAPRPDGGQGWPGLRLRPDIMGTPDGLAKYPYVREARRIRALFTVLEQHVGVEARQGLARKGAERFHDSVGVGSYAIDLHPTSAGDNYIDFETHPFELPLGSLIPVRLKNLLPACKNIGSTHVTNGCYRLHPVEWNIGETVGELVAFCIRKGEPPRAVRERSSLLHDFQTQIQQRGVEIRWPE